MEQAVSYSQDEFVPVVPDQVPDLHRDGAAADGPELGVDVRDVPPQGLRAGRHHEAELPPLPRSHQRLSRCKVNAIPMHENQCQKPKINLNFSYIHPPPQLQRP